jgi:hypothetical protein
MATLICIFVSVETSRECFVLAFLWDQPILQVLYKTQKDTCFEQGFSQKPARILMDLGVPYDGSQTQCRRGLGIVGLGISGPYLDMPLIVLVQQALIPKLKCLLPRNLVIL